MPPGSAMKRYSPTQSTQNTRIANTARTGQRSNRHQSDLRFGFSAFARLPRRRGGFADFTRAIACVHTPEKIDPARRLPGRRRDDLCRVVPGCALAWNSCFRALRRARRNLPQAAG